MRNFHFSGYVVFLLAFLAVLAAAPRGAVSGSGDEPLGPFAVDASTGLALDGYDPVSYFVAGRPRKGLRRYEVRWADVVWRFANSGNRDAFLRAPGVFAPRFGAHGALAVARGYPAQGSPLYWAVRGNRLYLFFSVVNRLAWLEEPDRLIARGEDNWRRIRKEIADF